MICIYILIKLTIFNNKIKLWKAKICNNDYLNQI